MMNIFVLINKLVKNTQIVCTTSKGDTSNYKVVFGYTGRRSSILSCAYLNGLNINK